MYCRIISGAVLGVCADMVDVEVDIAPGLPMFNMVGSLRSEVRESRERVCVALKNAGLSIPAAHITVNLSPADLKKEGTAYDLPIAVGILQSMEYFKARAAENMLFLGELGLNGELKRVRGVLPIVREAAVRGVTECIVPAANAAEGAVIPGIRVRGAEHISQVLAYLQARCGDKGRADKILPVTVAEEVCLFDGQPEAGGSVDFAHIKGQERAKRAAEIAASGFHNLLMTGPPGAGKSMIAKCIPGILPPLTLEESLEVTTVASVAGLLSEGQGLIAGRPFQSPHHTVSQTALTGGGTVPRPGVISLAHRGVLFLDELTEFKRSALDSLRQPLEDKQIQVARAGGTVAFPADFMLVGAMNPCPCGYYPDTNKCRCSEPQIKRYLARVSGPILDRMDLCVEMKAVGIEYLQNGEEAEDSRLVRERVMAARNVQKERFAGTGYRFNADIQTGDLESFCALDREGRLCMEKLYKTLDLSARVYHRILKVARTIADLEGEEHIRAGHLLEAASYRPSFF